MKASPEKTSPSLVVLAAGMGSRYGGLKQIEPVGPSGETVLDYSVHDALGAGFGKLVFVIRRGFEAAFREKVGQRYESRIDVRYVFQELDRLPPGHSVPQGREKPWGTGHAVWCAADEIAEPFAVINADDFYGADAIHQLGAFLARTGDTNGPARCCMIGFRLANTLSEFGAVSRGICTVGTDGRLQEVKEATGIESGMAGGHRSIRDGTGTVFKEDDIVSMNCWGLTPAIFPALDRLLAGFLATRGSELRSEFYIPSVVTGLIAGHDATVSVLPTTGTWFGVTYPQDRAHVVASLRELVRSGAYPSPLLS